MKEKRANKLVFRDHVPFWIPPSSELHSKRHALQRTREKNMREIFDGEIFAR